MIEANVYYLSNICGDGVHATQKTESREDPGLKMIRWGN